MKSPGTPWFILTSTPAILPRCSLCIGPSDPHLHPLYLQLFFQGILCTESPRTALACIHLNFSSPDKMLLAWRAPVPPSSYLPQFQLPHQGTLCGESPGSSWLIPTSFCPSCQVPSMHRAMGSLSLHPLQLQLFCQDNHCVESSGTSWLAHFSCPARAPSVQRASGLPDHIHFSFSHPTKAAPLWTSQ